jgi:ferritin
MPSIDDTMQAALNDQIAAEMYSAYLYLAMAAYFEASDLPGFASWMRVQAQEEDLHAHKLFDYLIERGGRGCCLGSLRLLIFKLRLFLKLLED